MSFTRRPGSGRFCLEWCHARRNWTAAELNQAVCGSLATNPDSISAVMAIGIVCGDPEVNAQSCFCFTATHRSHSSCDGMGCHYLQYTVTLVLIRGAMTVQRYVHDILQPHMLPLMQRLPGAIFQQDNARPYA
ncbi:HTH_Tnp_Tc3_2 domain-containing protein [Trichonephila clavipes]|nr:HTH_Tnp_Tc3_2 domain-containing protein [Trichonephila clavipes]